MSDFKDFLVVVVAPFLAIVILVFASVFGLALAVDKWQCADYAETASIETKHSGTVCYVKIDGAWLTRKQYDLTFIASEKK